MLKIVLSISLFFLLGTNGPFAYSDDSLSQKVLPLIYVSVEPYREIVQCIVGKEAKVISVVSSSLSSHTFEPSPKITQSISDGIFWFGIGEFFEEKLSNMLKSSLHSNIEYINLRHEIEEPLKHFIDAYPILGHGCCKKNHTHRSSHLHSIDPHIWISPILMSHQIDVIARILQKREDLFDRTALHTRATALQEKCQLLQKRAEEALIQHAHKSILTSHPAYGYLLAPFTIGQYAIEEEGKEPSPSYLTQIVEKIKKEGIQTIFTQMQYPSKGAYALSTTLGLKNQELDPYSPSYFQAMEKIIEAIASALTDQKPNLIDMRSSQDESPSNSH